MMWISFELQTAHAVARKHLSQRKIKTKEYYDRKIHDLKVEEGDWLLLKNPARKSKLYDLWMVPYNITKNGKEQTVHANRLKLFFKQTDDKLDIDEN